MSEYAEDLNAVLKILNFVTEPTYKQKVRYQRESSMELAKYQSGLTKQSNEDKYNRELLGSQLDALDSDINSLISNRDDLQSSYNSATAEWVKMDAIYQSAGGQGNYEEIFNNTTPYNTIQEGIARSEEKKKGLLLINEHLTDRINTIGNVGAFQTRTLDYERYTDTGEGIVDLQDVEGSWAESMIMMGYDPRSTKELFPNLDMTGDLNQYITSGSYDYNKLNVLKTDVPVYLRNFITINHPSNSQLKELQRDYTKTLSDDVTYRLNLLSNQTKVDGFLDPSSEDELDKLKLQHKGNITTLTGQPSILLASDIGSDAWGDYVKYGDSTDYALMSDYYTIINDLTDGLPGADWKDYTKYGLQRYDTNSYIVDSNGNMQIDREAVNENALAQEYYGEISATGPLASGMMSDDPATKNMFTHIGKNISTTTAHDWYWANNDNVRAEQWREDNPYTGDNSLKDLIDYKKKSILETTGDVIGSSVGDPTFTINMDQAQKSLNTEWDLYFEFVNQNPLAKLVGYDTWVQANDIWQVDPSMMVLDVIDPWMEVINNYSLFTKDLEQKGLEKNSEEWKTKVDDFLEAATSEYGGAVSKHSTRNLSKNHPLKDYYDNTVNPAFQISESDILKVWEEIVPMFINDADETLSIYDEKILAEQIRQGFKDIIDLEGASSTYLPQGPSTNAKKLQEKMKGLGFTSSIKGFSTNQGLGPNAGTPLGIWSNTSNLAFTSTTEDITTNAMNIPTGSNVVNNYLLTTDDIDWNSFITSDDFNDGKSYINNLYNTFTTGNGSAMAVPVHNIKSSNDSWTLAETYNNDGDKLLYHPATGPHPVHNYRDIYDDIFLEDQDMYSGSQFRISPQLEDDSNEAVMDLLTANYTSFDLIRQSDQHGRGFMPNIAYAHGLMSGPNFTLIDNEGIDEIDWIGKADEASLNNISTFDNDYLNAYALQSNLSIDRFNNHVVGNIFNATDRDNVFGNWQISKPSATYDEALGRYYLNFPVTNRPSLMTEDEFLGMEGSVQTVYLEDQYSWNVDQGVLGDSGFGIVTKNDMFLPDIENRNWITPKEAISPEIREKYENNEAFNVVYLKDPKGGRGHFVDLKVFYDYHLEESLNSDMSIDDVLYGVNGAIQEGYYDFDGYAGPTQNLLNSNHVFSSSDVYSYLNSTSPQIWSDIKNIDSSKELPIDFKEGQWDKLFKRELNKEMEYLGLNENIDPLTYLMPEYDQDIIDALDSLRQGK